MAVPRGVATADVKIQLILAASALPDASFAPVLIVAVYCVLPARGAKGVNVAVLPLTFTVPVTGAPPVVVTSVKVAVVSVELVIVLEKVADTGEFCATPVAAAAGDVEVTVGGVVSAAAEVVKFQVKSAAIALPAPSFAALVIVAMYCVLPARKAKGVNVAVLPLTFTVPVTGALPVVTSVKLAVVSVEVVIGLEKVADTEEFNATPVVATMGDVEDTVGGVVSGAAAVVKDQEKSAAIGLPAASATRLVMVAVYPVLKPSGTDGVNVAVLPLMLTVPATLRPPVIATRLKVAVFSVETVIALEKVAEIDEFAARPIAAFAGDVADTVGGVVSRAAPVVNFQVKLAAIGLPAASCAAVVIVAVYCVFAIRLIEGTNIAVLLLTSTLPPTAAPPAVGARVKLVVFSEEINIALEKVTNIDEFRATSIVASDGEVLDTLGGVLSGIVVVAPITITGGESPAPPPPQPNRLRLASRVAENMPAKILDPAFLTFDI